MLLRGLDGLLEGVRGGVGLLKLRPRPGLAAGKGIESSVSEPDEECGFKLPADEERRCGEACGLGRGVIAGLGPLLSICCSSLEASLEWPPYFALCCWWTISRERSSTVPLDFLVPLSRNRFSRSSSFSSQKLSHPANIGSASNSTGRNCPKFQALSLPTMLTPLGGLPSA